MMLPIPDHQMDASSPTSEFEIRSATARAGEKGRGWARRRVAEFRSLSGLKTQVTRSLEYDVHSISNSSD